MILRHLCLGLMNLRTLKVRTNADTPRDAKKAYEFGAEGIGLVSYRTYVL